ncbi:MAG: PEP-CTERM sorting domain-containing protein [Pirellulales bacterium]|nr:PEP-CTERM sorting domain-containing protein [Pirellulales bacterium]
MFATVCVSLFVLGILPDAATCETTTQWTEYASNPVYTPGKAYYPTILKEESTYTMWSDSTAGTQMATSTDGINWTTVGTATGLTSPRHTLVEKIDGSYRMWYWNSGLLYSIDAMRTAVSTDGLTWTNDQPLTQVGNSVIYNAGTNWNRGTYGPADVFYNPTGSSTIVDPVDEASVWANKFVMYYDGTTGGDESIGLAVSNDGLNWEGYNGGVAPVLAGTLVSGDWDYNYVSRCTVSKENDDLYHMWYSGGNGSMDDGVGYASSADGIHWTRDADSIFSITDGVAWRNDRTYTPMVIGDEMWFTGRNASGTYAIGYAVGVPEPATLGLLVTGLLALGGFSLRRRK